MSETSPSSCRRAIVEHDLKRGVREGLQAISEPIDCNSYAIEAFVNNFAEGELTELVQAGTLVEGPMPYGVALFPYRVLEQFCDDKSEPPNIPNSIQAIEKAIALFWPGGYRFSRRTRNSLQDMEQQEIQAREKLQQALFCVANNGHSENSWTQALSSLVRREIREQQWQQFSDAHTRQLKMKDAYTLDRLSYMGLFNLDFNERFGLFRELTGRHGSFLFTTSTDNMFRTSVATQIPIGPYGQTFAKRILLTARFMSLYDQKDYAFRSTAINSQKDYWMVENHTTRANGYDAPIVPDSFVSGLQESDQEATPGDYVLLTSSIVPGFDKDESAELINQLTEDDMPDELAIRARQGLVATALAYGIYIPNLVGRKPDGHLKISAEGNDCLQALQEISDGIGAQEIAHYNSKLSQYEIEYRQWRERNDMSAPPKPPKMIRTFRACPYAGLNRTSGTATPGAISRRSLAFNEVFKHMSPITDSKEHRNLEVDPRFNRLLGYLAAI